MRLHHLHIDARQRARGVAGLLAALAVVLGIVATSGTAATPALVPDGPLAAHSMLYGVSPLPFKDAMFRNARDMGASEIRVDIELSDVFASSPTTPNWTNVDQFMQLAATYHLRVLADITATPYYLARCPAGRSDWWSCGVDDPTTYGSLVGQTAAHTKGYIDDFEIINEPDGTWAFSGTPSQYAWMLSKSYDAIHAANPQARVLNGGLSTARPGTWMTSVFNTPGADAAHKFDVANVHIREWGAEYKLAGDAQAWKAYFAAYGFKGPMWVTEHGYPSNPINQADPAYRSRRGTDGLTQQSLYLHASLPALVTSGVAKVFVTERDNLGGGFASEGVLGGPSIMDPVGPGPTYSVIIKPAFTMLTALSPQLTALANGSSGTTTTTTTTTTATTTTATTTTTTTTTTTLRRTR